MSGDPINTTAGCVSGCKYRWVLPPTDETLIARLAAEYGVCAPIMQVLVRRGLVEREHIEPYLFPEQHALVHEPHLLADAVTAVDRIDLAIKHQQRILIAGDYDVDGLTSTSLMLLCLRELGAQVNYFLPHRLHDGYGLSARTIARAHASGYQLVVTVDNGISAHEAGQAAQKLGIDLVITDHHRQHGPLPTACAVVDPNRDDCPYPFKHLAGVGVAFKLMQLLFERRGRQLPNKMYELLALGTIADVVPLIGENRVFVRRGLAALNELASASTQILKANGRTEKPILSSQDVAFVLAPQLNALGRLEDPRAGVQFLIGAERTEIEAIGQTLLQLNEARKVLERDVCQQIEEAIAARRIDLEHEHIIMAAHAGWAPGVIGLVASRLVAAYGRPAFLFHIGTDGMASGSCRSIAQFNVFQALSSVAPLLERFGGHAMAAGVKIRADRLPELKQALEDAMRVHVGAQPPVPTITVDACAQLPDIDQRFVHDLDQLEPFGNGNESPVFYFSRVCLVEPPRLLKDVHVKCKVYAAGAVHNVIFFSRPDVFQALMQQPSQSFDLVAQVSQNYWQSQTSIELRGLDVSIKQG